MSCDEEHSKEEAVKLERLAKSFLVYKEPIDRLKQAVAGFFGSQRKYSTEICALRDVNFSIRPGESFGIVGHNGSGKSTLLQLICGLLEPSSGTVRINGRIAALLELGSGFSPEYTGRENILLNASLLGLSNAQIDEAYDDIVRFADIGDFIDKPVKIYSTGMMMRLAFAVATSVDANILIIDEALSVGDELFQRKCFSRIEKLKENGATIIFVSHAPSAVIELCDRALLLDRGECLAIGEPKAVIGAYQKLIYSSSDQRELMRQELINYYPSDGKIASDKDCKPEKTEDEREFDESYDPSLVSKSVIEYQSLGVRLSNPRIQLQNGKIVNRLLRGRQYTIVYDCEILEDAHGLHYGLMIKTVSGIELGGASYAGDLGGMSVQAGQKFEVQAIFECRLKSGFYFANVGVVGEREGTQVFLHRLVDAVCFRVEPDDNIITGMIDFDCLFDLKLA